MKLPPPRPDHRLSIDNLVTIMTAVQGVGLQEVFYKFEEPDSPLVAVSIAGQSPTVTEMCRALGKAGYRVQFSLVKEEMIDGE